MGFNKKPRWVGNKKRKAPNYKTGDFRVHKPKKYVGNPNKSIAYRSSYELRFMHQLEANPNVLAWNFENIIIPYTIRYGVVVKRHNYIMDFQVKMKSGMYLCEVKPSNKAPKSEKELRKSDDHKRNAHKWKAAMAWCKANNHTFKLIMERQLGIKN